MKNEPTQPAATTETPTGEPSPSIESSSPVAAPAATPTDSPSKGEGALRISSGFARLLAARDRARKAEDGGDPDFDRSSDAAGDDGLGTTADDGGAPRDPRKALVAAAITAAVTPIVDEALWGKSTQAVVVSVPAGDWIVPVKEFFEQRPFGKKWLCFARDGSERLRHKPSIGNAEVASALAKGRSVIGIAVDPDQVLPSTLVAGADQRVKLKLDESVLGGVLSDLYGEAPPRIDEVHLARLGLDDIVAAMRPGVDAREVASRILAAATAMGGAGKVEDVPDLATAVEYGTARAWGLALARDMRDYRAGIIPWSAVDRGAVFFSGPGMGKSVLARSIAHACEASLVVGSVGELFAASSGHLDGVIKSMRELFARAMASAPAILFLDEIDGLPSRESLDSRNRDWWMPVIEDFMLQLDDATSGRREGIVVIGATNRIDAIDPAILRPGRLERAIEITAPDAAGILNILRFHVQGDVSDDELRTVIGPLEGSTPAEIMQTVRSARRKARRAGRHLSIEDVRSAALPESELPVDMVYRIAVHEAGHVLAAYCSGFRVESVRIVGRGGTGGVTRIDQQDPVAVTRPWIERHVVGLLAGRAAEIVLLGSASAGAGGSERSDLSVATRLLAAMNRSYGLGDDELIYLADAGEAHRELDRNHVARRKINEMLKRLQARAVEVVENHRRQVADVADALSLRRFLSADDIEAIVGQSPPSPMRSKGP